MVKPNIKSKKKQPKLTIAPTQVTLEITFPCDIDDITAKVIDAAVEVAKGNKTQAAMLIGIDRRTLYRWLEKKAAKRAA